MQAGCEEDSTGGVQAGAAIGERVGGRTVCEPDCACGKSRWQRSDSIDHDDQESASITRMNWWPPEVVSWTGSSMEMALAELPVETHQLLAVSSFIDAAVERTY